MLELSQAFVDDFITQAFGLPIAHENESYEPTRGTTWVRLRMFPGQVVAGDVNADTLETAGFFQVTLNYPSGEGAIPAKQQLQTIFNAYPLGRRVSYSGESARVTSHQQFDASNESGWFQVVGRIFYEKE